MLHTFIFILICIEDIQTKLHSLASRFYLKNCILLIIYSRVQQKRFFGINIIFSINNTFMDTERDTCVLLLNLNIKVI